MAERKWPQRGRTDEAVLKALRENNYDINETARALNYVRPKGLVDRINANPALKEEVEQHQATRKRRRFSSISDETYIKAIYEAKGIKSVVANLLGVNISGVYTRINNSPELQEAVRLASEGFKDVAETKLFELVEAGDFQAIKFYLSTRARDRGYGNKVEISGTTDVNYNWNLQVLGVEELLALEALARKALPEGNEDVIDARFIEDSAENITD